MNTTDLHHAIARALEDEGNYGDGLHTANAQADQVMAVLTYLDVRPLDQSWHDAAIQADYCWRRLSNAQTLSDQAQSLVDLGNAMFDLRTFLPGYDENSGTLPWEREDD